MNTDIYNFRDLVDKSFKAEYGNELYEESRKRDREFAQSSGPVSRKRCVWIPLSDFSHVVSALDHQPPYIVHLNPIFLLGILLDNQVFMFLSFHVVFVSNVDLQATMFESVPTIM